MNVAREAGEMDGVARVSAGERDDWTWMVDEDPAFYLEEGL